MPGKWNSVCTGLIGMCSEYLRDKERTSRLEGREEGSMLRKKAAELSRGQNSPGRARVWVLFCCFVENGLQ